MKVHHDRQRSPGRNWSGEPLPSAQVLKELEGRPCACCGTRQYYLVLRMKARGDGPTLAARCSRCHEGNWSLSEDRLARDIEQTPWEPTYRNAGLQRQ